MLVVVLTPSVLANDILLFVSLVECRGMTGVDLQYVGKTYKTMQLMEDFDQSPIARIVRLDIPWVISSSVEEVHFIFRNGKRTNCPYQHMN
jgi:hypothetical protein